MVKQLLFKKSPRESQEKLGENNIFKSYLGELKGDTNQGTWKQMFPTFVAFIEPDPRCTLGQLRLRENL